MGLHGLFNKGRNLPKTYLSLKEGFEKYEIKAVVAPMPVSSSDLD